MMLIGKTANWLLRHSVTLSKLGAKMAIFGKTGVLMLNYGFGPPKGTSLRGTASFGVFLRQNGYGRLEVGDEKN